MPLQEFTSESDIDRTQSIAEIDQHLYTEFGLDENEIAFVEAKIKPMVRGHALESCG